MLKFILLIVSALLISCSSETLVSPERRTIKEAVFASGQLTQKYEYVVSASSDGIILDVVVSEGDSVQQGDKLATIESTVQALQFRESQLVSREAVKNAGQDSPQLLALQAQIEQARLQLQMDSINYQRYTALRKSNAASPLELENAELRYVTSKKGLAALEENYRQATEELKLASQRSQIQLKAQAETLSEYILVADKPGVVLDVYKKKGELVRKGEIIARLGSGPYILKLYISEEDIPKVRVGQTAAVSLNTYPDSSFTATVTKILPGFDQAERSYVAEAAFTRQPGFLLAGTQLQASITTGIRNNLLLIPKAALVKENTVVLENGDRKVISTGKDYEGWVEVRSGLSEQDRIRVPERDDTTEKGELMLQ